MIVEFITTVANVIAAARVERATIKELNNLSDRDLDDIGISRSDIPYIAKQEADIKFVKRFKRSNAVANGASHA